MKFFMILICILTFPAYLAALPYPFPPSSINLKLPQTQDPDLYRLLYSPDTIYYKLDQAYQKDGRVYHTNFLKDFNANQDFPWETTLGLNISHKSKENPYRTLNVLKLPQGKPILILPGRPVRWIFPEETTVGEIIYVVHKGERYVQEIRTRTKEKGAYYWSPDIYRPIASKQEFLALLDIKVSFPKKHMFFRNPEEDEVAKLDGHVDRLPDMYEKDIKYILSLPFKNVTKERWSPMADQDFHILPKNYSLGLIKPSSTNCMVCHKQTGISVSNLIPKEPSIKLNPGRVGSIRGYDGIFTWHPFDESSISQSDKEFVKQIRLRDYDFNNRLVVLLDNSMIKNGKVIYNNHTYLLTREVQKSLTGKELPGIKEVLHQEDPVFNLFGSR